MKVQYAETIRPYIVTLTNANTEYEFTIPDEAVAVEFQARQSADVRWSTATGEVAAGDEYYTLKSGGEYWADGLYLNKHTLYFASSSAGTVVEILVYK